MEPEPPQDRVFPYRFIEPSEDQPPHQHSYEYTSGGEYVVRHCECNKSWALVELRSLIDNSTIYVWRETKEESEL